MTVCLFLSFRAAAEPIAIPSDEVARVHDLVAGLPGLRRALVHLAAARADDPYLDDGTPPALVLQLYFADLPALEAACARDGALQALADAARFPRLAACEAVQQAMLVREFAVADPRIRAEDAYCTYLVAYEGEAEDLNRWLDHYLAHHTVCMARFPDIRELEVYTRLDWVSFLPFRRVAFMQRNKVAFDSLAALSAALQSPVRHEMRADYQSFPPFTGTVPHFAFATRVVMPA